MKEFHLCYDKTCGISLRTLGEIIGDIIPRKVLISAFILLFAASSQASDLEKKSLSDASGRATNSKSDTSGIATNSKSDASGIAINSKSDASGNALDSLSEVKEKVSLMPEFHGAVRPRWEIDTETGESRFEVRWARFTVGGKVAPRLSYFFQVDFCDQGAIKLNDAYVKLGITEYLQIQAGQFRMPFGTEPFMSPLTYVFANRSFMGKQMCNNRKVGAKLIYELPIAIPLTLEAGAFNSGTITNHNSWSKTYVGSGRATLQAGDFKICAGIMDLKPDKTRIMLYDCGVTWQHGDFRAAAEYMNEHYVKNTHRDAHSWVAWGDYGRAAKLGIFNRWSVQARYDGMTDQWNGIEGDIDNPGRHRITLGATLTYHYKKVFADLMLNYENYHYFNNYIAPTGQSSKVVTEIAIRF